MKTEFFAEYIAEVKDPPPGHDFDSIRDINYGEQGGFKDYESAAKFAEAHTDQGYQWWAVSEREWSDKYYGWLERRRWVEGEETEAADAA